MTANRLDPIRSRERRRDENARQTSEAVNWRVCETAVPTEFGPWWRAAQLHIRWPGKETWSKLFEAFRHQGRPDLTEVLLNSPNLRVDTKAAGAKSYDRVAISRHEPI